MLFSAILNPSLDCFLVVFLFLSYISVKSHLTLSQCFILELNSLLYCTASACRCCINAVNGKRPNHKRVLLSADYPKMWLSKNVIEFYHNLWLLKLFHHTNFESYDSLWSLLRTNFYYFISNRFVLSAMAYTKGILFLNVLDGLECITSLSWA